MPIMRQRELGLVVAALGSAAWTGTAQVSMPLAYKAKPIATAALAQSSSTPVPERGFLNFLTIGAEEGATGTEGLHMIVEKELDYVAYVDPSTNRVKAAAASIERLEALNPQIWAYFASLEFEGNQVIDVLVDTGSAGMGVPIQMPVNWTESEEAPFVSLDLGKAGAETVLCKDPRCRGACDAPGKDHFCSPKGGSCRTNDEGTDICIFSWLYGDGSSASGSLVTSKVGMAGLEVRSTFGAIDTASTNFFEAPHGGGIMGGSPSP
ncbi:hypothetical protein VYU27_007622 [Nannochloropsis oceanica]